VEREQILEGFAEVAVKLLNVKPEQVTEEARFDEDLGVDSLGLVEFVMEVEDVFGVKIPEEELDGITTVGQAADLVQQKLGAPAERGATG
jgi:acyl carrier protein